LVGDKEYCEFIRKRDNIQLEFDRLGNINLMPTPGTNDQLKALGSAPLKNPTSLIDLLRRPEISYSDLNSFYKASALTDPAVAEEVEIQVKYAGYIKRQEEQVGKLLRLENIRFPANLDFKDIPGLTAEVREKLGKVKPLSLGQASRISGITPAAISILMIYLKKIAVAERGFNQPSSHQDQD
jgi:tRNA uridine 5-carboxymethylaminomethyl modification enzyme